MTAFSLVPTSMYDHTFARLSRLAQVVELYLRSCPQRSSEGLFRFGLGTAEDDLGIDRADLRGAFRELCEARRPFMYDADAAVVLDMSALQHTRLGRRRVDDWSGKPDNRIEHAIRKLNSLPPTPLLKHLLVVADEHSPEFADAMRAAFPHIEEPLQAPTEGPSHAPSQEPSQAAREGASRAESRRGEESRVAPVVQRDLRDTHDVTRLSREFNGEVVAELPSTGRGAR